MARYSDISAHGRDALTALFAEAGPTDRVTAAEVRERCGQIREEEPSDYTYEVLSRLADDGYVIQDEAAGDDRLTMCRLSPKGLEAVRQRRDLLTPGGEPSETPDPQPVGATD